MTAPDPARLDLLCRYVEAAVDRLRLPGAQLAVAHAGDLVLDRSFGGADPSRRYVLQSAGRSVLASLAWLLLSDGLLSLDDRVADVVPDFATNGKEAVTVEQVLTHTAGFPYAPLGFPAMQDRADRLAAFGRWRLTTPPGEVFQYHLTSAAWVIAELVERLTGRTVADALQAEIAQPAGLSLEVGVPVDRQEGTVAPMTATDRTRADEEVDPWGPWYLSRPEVLAAGEPSHSIVGTARDLALFFQHVVRSGRWDPATLADATRPHVVAVPAGEQLYGGRATPVSTGLFVGVADGTGGSFLPTVGSPRVWGNGGAAYQTAFVDPDTETSVAVLTNGYPLSGYDYSPRGVAYLTTVANLAADLV